MLNYIMRLFQEYFFLILFNFLYKIIIQVLYKNSHYEKYKRRSKSFSLNYTHAHCFIYKYSNISLYNRGHREKSTVLYCAINNLIKSDSI